MKTNVLFVLTLTLLVAGSIRSQDLRQRLVFDHGAICHDLVRIPGGQMLLVGETTGTPYPTGWVASMSSLGQITWTQTPYDLTRSSSFTRILADTDSTFYIAGTQFVDPVKGTDILVFRMNLKGKIYWSRTLHVNLADSFQDMQLTQKGIVLVGSTLDQETGVDIVVAVMDDQGELQISRQFGAAGLDSPVAVHRIGSKELLISGTTTSYTFPGAPPSGFLLKLSSQMDFTWMKLFGDADAQDVTSLTLDANGNALVAANDAGGVGVHYIICFNGDGDLVWSKSYSCDAIEALARTGSGKVNAADKTSVFALDPDGKVISSWFIQPDQDFNLTRLTPGEKGQILMSGWTAKNQDFPAIHSIQDPWTSSCDVTTAGILSQDYSPLIIDQLVNQKDVGSAEDFQFNLGFMDITDIIDCQTTSLDDQDEQLQAWSIQPNLTTGQATIVLPDHVQGWLTWYDASGRVLSRRTVQEGQNRMDHDLSPWPAGVYWVEFRSVTDRWVEKVIRMD